MDINIIGSVNQLGYGLVTTNLVSELSKEHRVSLFSINRDPDCHQKHAPAIQQAIDNGRLQPNFNSPCIRIWHQFDMSLFCGDYKIGFPIFELDEFTPQEKHHLSGLDEIFVCSEWAADVIEANKIGRPVTVIPLGVDTELFKPMADSETRPYRFLAAGKWEYRKGHDVVLRAFTEEFSQDDDVELVCLCDNPVIPAADNLDWNQTFKQSPLGNKILLVPRQPTQEAVCGVMNKVDCGVFPARAEGWNLELIEMMACNKPVITTNYSGHTEFCNRENSELIECFEKEIAFDGFFFKQNIGSWMKFTDENIETLKQKMRYAYENRVKTNPAGVETARKFSWKHSAEKIAEVI